MDGRVQLEYRSSTSDGIDLLVVGSLMRKIGYRREFEKERSCPRYVDGARARPVSSGGAPDVVESCCCQARQGSISITGSLGGISHVHGCT